MVHASNSLSAKGGVWDRGLWDKLTHVVYIVNGSSKHVSWHQSSWPGLGAADQ